MDTEKAIYTRRSIRKFKSDSVSLDVIKELISASLMAPSWINSECERFVVVDKRELIDQIADEACAAFRSKDILHGAPCLLVVCADTTRCGKGSHTRNGKMPEWFMFDTALAVENLSLLATDRGLGTVIIGGFDMDIAKTMLNVPEDIEVVCLIALGYPDENPVMPQRRKIEEVAWHNSFDDALE